ncbi:MAG: DNA repair protein RecO [bacterium]|nr:DNA repair protein RecO [bacterium]
MYHIYHTEGIILGSRNFSESGKYYYIFTRDLGMVTASAQGVRKMSSRLRYILQDFAYLKIDLVRGRDFWRVTSASKTNALEEISKQPATFKIFSKIARLLRRLLPGEDANQELFTDLIKGLSVLEKSNTKEELQNIEVVIVLRILNSLGYISEQEVLKDLIKSPFGDDIVSEVSKSRIQILRQINKALKETHL